MRRRNKHSLNIFMVYVLFFACSTITVVHILNNRNSNDLDLESLYDKRHSSRFWALCDRCKEKGADNSLYPGKFHRLKYRYSLDTHRSTTVNYETLKAFVNEPGVNSLTVFTLLHAVLHGATWIFAARHDRDPHGLVPISELTDTSTQHGMVYCRSGVFEQCRHFIDTDELLGRDRKRENSNYYVVRRVSSMSVRVLPDSEACMPPEKSPSVTIMPGTYAAVSFQDALLHRDLFWMSILHHLNVAEQSSLRHLSIFLQRLLWETEHQLILFRPSPDTEQVDPGLNHSRENRRCRTFEFSSWDGLKDFAFTVSGLRCTYEHSTFLQCALELVDLVFSNSNTEFAALKRTLILWFKTLDSFGYDFPKRVPFTTNKLLQKKWGIPVIFSAPKTKPYFHFHTCTLTEPTEENVNEEQNIIEKESPDISLYDNEVIAMKRGQNLGEINVEPNGKNDTTDIMDLIDTDKGTDVENEFTSLCRSVNTVYKPIIPERFKFEDILLIVVFNYPYLVSHIPKLLTMYGRHFQHILFCGEKIHTFGKFYSVESNVRVSFVQITHQQGHWAYSCTAAAIKMGYNTSGFLQISDDMLLNVWNLEGLPRDKPWFQPRVRVADVRMRRLPDIATTSRWFPWIFGAGRTASRFALNTLRQLTKDHSIGLKVQRFLKQLRQNSGCSDCLMYEASDIFYIPSWMKKDYVLFADLFHLHRLHLELAVPTILFGLTEEHQVVRLRGNYLWGEGPRAKFLKFYSPHDHFQHAWKLTRLVDQSGDGGGGLRFFCRVFLPKVDGDLIGTTGMGNHGQQRR